MAKEQLLKFTGTITDKLPNARYKVAIEEGQEVVATVKGNIRNLRHRMAIGDQVDLEVTPYDLEKGRITSRHG